MLRDDDATNPDLQPGPNVLDRILAVARAEVRRGRRLPLDQPTRGRTSLSTVSEQAVTAVIRSVGDRGRQVQIRRCTVALDTTGAGPSHDQDVVDLATEPFDDPGPATVRVSLRVSVAGSLPIARTSEELRASVIGAVAREVGLDVVSVDIAVEDIHDA